MKIEDELEKLDAISKVDSEEQITRKVKSNLDVLLQELKKYTSNKKLLRLLKNSLYCCFIVFFYKAFKSLESYFLIIFDE